MSEMFLSAPPEHIQKKRKKARELRKSQWWMRKLNEGVCYYCEGKFPPKELTMDHKVPLARGGMSVKANLVPACKPCNDQKKHDLAIDFMPDTSANKSE